MWTPRCGSDIAVLWAVTSARFLRDVLSFIRVEMCGFGDTRAFSAPAALSPRNQYPLLRRLQVAIRTIEVSPPVIRQGEEMA